MNHGLYGWRHIRGDWAVTVRIVRGESREVDIIFEGDCMAIAEISIIPVGTETASVSKYVARAVKVLQGEKDIKYEVGAMGTILEGDLERILAVAKRMHEETFAEGINRVITTIKIDERRDKLQSMSDKVISVMKELEH